MGLRCKLFRHKFRVQVNVDAMQEGSYEFPRECVRCGQKGILHVDVRQEATALLITLVEEKTTLKLKHS